MVKEKKEMEYEEAPSGYVTLYNYKEPFMKFEEGYGYQGVLLFDGSTDKIQCHMCGEWFGALPQHLAKEHNMRASDYKEAVGLRQTTALVNESTRAKMIANGQERFKNLIAGGKKTEEDKEKIRQSLKRVYRETQNERGTCPEQLVNRLQKKYKELGRLPSSKRGEFVGYETVNRVWGSMQNLCEAAGVPYREPGRTITFSKENRYKFYLAKLREFVSKNGRLPKAKEKGVSGIYQWMWKHLTKKERGEMTAEALIGDGVYRKVDKIIHFTNDQLIRLLVAFKKVNGRDPSTSDCKRGLLPCASKFYSRFGNWKNTLDLIK